LAAAYAAQPSREGDAVGDERLSLIALLAYGIRDRSQLLISGSEPLAQQLFDECGICPATSDLHNLTDEETEELVTPARDWATLSA
jgi:hypothetical protein